MSEASLKITELDGWGKIVPLDKSVIKIGSGSYCDVQLPSSDIAPLHLQVFYSSELPTSCRVVNLASPVEYRHRTKTELIGSLSTLDLHNGCRIRLGDYTIGFSLPLSGEVEEEPHSMAASLHFGDQVLRPDSPLEGLLTVKNLGNDKTCQFQVALAGLPADCYLIDPIPLIYPSAQEEVRVQLFHKTTYPTAGWKKITMTITAPASYPGEALIIEQEIYVTPIFDQKLEIFDDLHPFEKLSEAASLAVSAELQPIGTPAPAVEVPGPAAPVPVVPIPPVEPLRSAVPVPPAAVETQPAPEPLLSTAAVVFSPTVETAPVGETPLWSVPIGMPSEPEPAIPTTKPKGPAPVSVPPVQAEPDERVYAAPATPSRTPPAIAAEESIPVSAVPASAVPASAPGTAPAAAPVAAPAAAAPAPKRDLSGLKVVRDQANDFWDNE